MLPRWPLVVVSAAQLAVGLAGQVIATRRRLNCDTVFPPVRGNPDRVARDAFVLGTALSAPVPMLAAQALCTVRLARRDDRTARRALGVLGAAMTAGYLVERTGQHALTPRGLDPVVTPVVGGGTGLAAAMAVLGLGRGF